MMAHLRPTLLALLLCFGAAMESVCLYAQVIVPREHFLSWDEFVSEFLDQEWGKEDEAPEFYQQSHTIIERLEEKYNNPINLNTATREDLIELDFLSSEQADSILSTRARLHIFSSPGDLMVVRGLGYRERRWLSLFVVLGDTIQQPSSRWRSYYEGSHIIESRWDIPLYKRAGFQIKNQEEIIKNRHRIYLGSPIAHTLRYRYNWKNQIAYGLTFQKDSGEPFGKYGQHPYDHFSGFFKQSSGNGKTTWILGDYRLHIGQGLLIGNGFFFNPSQTALHLPYAEARLRPHTGTDEVRFLRGAALSVCNGSWRGIAFASHRRLDGRIENDTLRSFITDGLHRSLNEIKRKGAIGLTTIGVHGEWRKANRHIGVSGMYLHYDHIVFPTPRPYNQHAFRGQTTGGFSVDASWKGKNSAWQSEIAFDTNGNLATIQLYRQNITRRLNGSLQVRHFSPGYISPLGYTKQADSQIQNETGTTLALHYRIKSETEIRGVLDYHYHSQPAFRAYAPHDGWRGQIEMEWGATNKRQQIRYTHISRQYNIIGHAPHLEYITTHRLRFQSRRYTQRLEWNWAADASAHHQQTRPQPHFGGMLSARATWRPNEQWRLSAFSSIFATHDYSTRLYTYVPQLRGVTVFPSFSDIGVSTVLLALYRINRHWEASARWGITHYFDRQYISSGMQQINRPTQSDIGFYLRYRI